MGTNSNAITKAALKQEEIWLIILSMNQNIYLATKTKNSDLIPSYVTL